MYCFYRKKVVTMIMEETTMMMFYLTMTSSMIMKDDDDYGNGGRRSRRKNGKKVLQEEQSYLERERVLEKSASNISVCIFSTFKYLWLACNCLSVQIQATKRVLVKGGIFIAVLINEWWYNDNACYYKGWPRTCCGLAMAEACAKLQPCYLVSDSNVWFVILYSFQL